MEDNQAVRKADSLPQDCQDLLIAELLKHPEIMAAVTDLDLGQLAIVHKLYKSALTDAISSINIADRERMDQTIAWLQGSGAFVQWITGVRQQIKEFFDQQREEEEYRKQGLRGE